jgi:hypothetical protein
MEYSLMVLGKLGFCKYQYGSNSEFPERYSTLNFDKIFKAVYEIYGNVHVYPYVK